MLIGTSLYKMELAHPDNQKHYALPRYGIQFEPKRIMTTRTGDIYFVVLGGGLYRYDKQTDSFIHYSHLFFQHLLKYIVFQRLRLSL